MGGNPQRGNYERRLEIYSPAYLFNGDGTAALRPTITGLTAETVNYSSPFVVQTPDAADIASVVLVRPGTPTHAFDMDQRLVGLSFTAGSGVLNVTAPPNGNIAPPGYYMLFVLNGAGVPSVARFVRLPPRYPIRPRLPRSRVRRAMSPSILEKRVVLREAAQIRTALSVRIAGRSPAVLRVRAQLPTPGNVSYSTPGSYVASFIVTDDKGLASQPATRTITVSNFSVSATPSSQAVMAGQSATYTATVTPASGFTGTVDFSVTGLPSGATATFTPPSVTGSGSTSLPISTTGTTPSGTYPLVISGTSGPITRTANVTLIVNGDFAIAASPASRTINRGNSTTYTVTVSGRPGFSGPVNLTVSGIAVRARPEPSIRRRLRVQAHPC